MGGFLDKLWHHAASRVSQDVSHPSQGLSDLANLAYNMSGAHDVVDAYHDPGNWEKDLRAGAAVGGFLLPGVLAGRTLGHFGVDALAKYGLGALPGAMEVASNPADPQGYINTVLGEVPTMAPTGAVDHLMENSMGVEKQKALAAAISSALGGSSN